MLPKLQKIEQERCSQLILSSQHYPDTKTRQRSDKKIYRPISFIKVDTKIIQTLANWISTIYQNDNISWCHSLGCYNNNNKTRLGGLNTNLFLSLESEKSKVKVLAVSISVKGPLLGYINSHFLAVCSHGLF